MIGERKDREGIRCGGTKTLSLLSSRVRRAGLKRVFHGVKQSGGLTAVHRKSSRLVG